jgi:hypothetical protein
MPEELLGVEKVALAEWKTDIPSTSSTVGQVEIGGVPVPVKVGFCW